MSLSTIVRSARWSNSVKRVCKAMYHVTELTGSVFALGRDTSPFPAFEPMDPQTRNTMRMNTIDMILTRAENYKRRSQFDDLLLLFL